MIHPKVFFATLFVLLIAGLIALIFAFASPPPTRQASPQYVRDHIFGVMSTDRLCERLRSPDYMTRETALLAMKAYHNVMPADIARALCEAVVSGSIGSQGREMELMDFHLDKHRTIISGVAKEMLEEFRSTGSIALCNGGSMTLTPANIQSLEDWLRSP